MVYKWDCLLTPMKGAGQAMGVASLIEDDISDITVTNNVKGNIVNGKHKTKICRINENGKQ